MTRVLIIESAGNLWGSERALLDLIEGADRLKIAVCCPPGTPLHHELQRRNVSVLPYFIDRLHEKAKVDRLKAAAGVLRACVEFRPDVIHLNQSGTFKVVSIAASLLRLPIVAHVRIFEDAEYLASLRPDLRRLRAIIAISRAIQVEVERFDALSGIRLHCLYDAYAPSDSFAEGAKKVRRIVCVGRIAPIKGQDVLIAALSLLPDVECLVVGSGEAAFVEPLKKAAVDGGSKVEWLGFREDVGSFLATAPVMVCPSAREPLGRVIFEAWNAGAIPVVFAGSGGAAEVVVASRGGVIYQAQTPEALASAIRTALDLDDDGRARMVERGREWMSKNCSPKGYGAAVERVLSQAASRPSQRIEA